MGTMRESVSQSNPSSDCLQMANIVIVMKPALKRPAAPAGEHRRASQPLTEADVTRTEILGDLRRRLTTIHGPHGTTNLAVADELSPTTEILSGLASLADGVHDTLSFDRELHLRARRHDREQHRSHRHRNVHVPSPEIQHAQCRTSSTQLVSERQHVLCRAPQTVEGGDHERVAIMQRIDR
jgi:hypothetical protein